MNALVCREPRPWPGPEPEPGLNLSGLKVLTQAQSQTQIGFPADPDQQIKGPGEPKLQPSWFSH